jgi:hypothetical protein
MQLHDGQGLARLVKAREDVDQKMSVSYDEVLDEVADRIAATGSIGKVDIGALLFWKRLRANTPWVAKLHGMADVTIRGVTAAAVAAVRDNSLEVAEAAGMGRAALSGLPGFSSGDALASALLTAAAPDRMAVYDRRAQSALAQLEIELGVAPGRYGRYMRVVEGLRQQASALSHRAWTARDVDLSLYWLGG